MSLPSVCPKQLEHHTPCDFRGSGKRTWSFCLLTDQWEYSLSKRLLTQITAQRQYRIVSEPSDAFPSHLWCTSILAGWDPGQFISISKRCCDLARGVMDTGTVGSYILDAWFRITLLFNSIYWSVRRIMYSSCLTRIKWKEGEQKSKPVWTRGFSGLQREFLGLS